MANGKILKVPGDLKRVDQWRIRRLSVSDYDAYYELRLQSLVECPPAFTTDAEAWRKASRETIEAHLSADRQDSPVLAASLGDEQLVGLIGLKREQRPAVAHKASVWGFYVLGQYRGRGAGRGLIVEAINIARASNVRQMRAVVPTVCREAMSLLSSVGFESFGLEREARFVDGKFHDQEFLAYQVIEADGD